MTARRSDSAPAALVVPATFGAALAEVWAIAWPTVMTMTSYTIMQFADKLMVGQVGPLEVAAQGNGGIWSFMPIAVAMGVLTVVNTFVSQNLGAGRLREAPKYAWAALWLSAVVWLVVMVPWAGVMETVFDLVHASQLTRVEAMQATASGDALASLRAEEARLHELMPMETRYARILLLGSVLLMAGRGIHHYFFGLHRPKVVTVAAILGNLTNIVANYVLIFGAAGLTLHDAEGAVRFSLPGMPGVPALGLEGAAIGTVLGTAVELAIPLAIFLGPRMNHELRTRAAWRPRWGPMRDLLKVGAPAGAQFGNEIICWSIFMSTLVGLFGTHHQTAGWIALGYIHLSFMPAVGFSVAVTSLVGKYIGAGRPEVATHRARLGVGIAVVWMTICGAAFFVFREPMIAAFIGGDAVGSADAAAIVSIGARLMICGAIFQTIDAFGIVYTGALRGAGDTVWPGIVTIIYSWTLIIGGGWTMTRLFPELESVGPWLGATAYIIIYGITMSVRFESGRWRSIDLVGRDDDPARVAPVGPAPPASRSDAAIADRVGEVADEVAEGRDR